MQLDESSDVLATSRLEEEAFVLQRQQKINKGDLKIFGASNNEPKPIKNNNL